jgi:membrane-bound metal-dependent hydrolase YbcI (DUF457 family)
MNWKSHLAFGFFCGAAACYLAFSRDVFAVFLFASVSGFCALIPDIDLRKSKFSQLTYALAAFAIIAASVWLAGGRGIGEFFAYLALLALICLLLDWVLRPRHRGITHRLPFLALVGAVAYAAFGLVAACAVAIGYCSHLVADGALKAK